MIKPILSRAKIAVKLALTHAKDYRNGNYQHFCRDNISGIQFRYCLTFRQEIKPSTTLANKLYNLKTASEKINRYIIMPNEIFSFWKVVGNPERQFKASRSIIQGQTVNQIGGGICQVSGIVYLASIQAQLEILERHHHSLDLYTDETRFTPLGTDATVVYGYKDLRIRNSFNFPIKFVLSVEENDTILQIQLWSVEPITQHSLQFQKQQLDTFTEVFVSYDDGTPVNHSRYYHL